MDRINIAYLLLGSNIEPRYDYITEALGMLGKDAGEIRQVSEVYESEPWGFSSDTSFLNVVVVLETAMTAEGLLKHILLVEKNMGRTRKGKGYASRKIDIDILYYNGEIYNLPDLIIPHPRLHERRFTLRPLADVAPDMIHPVLKMTNSELLSRLNDKSSVVKFKKQAPV